MARILLIDDDPNMRRVVRLRCEQAGHTAVEADSAYHALDMLKTDKDFDVVVCDVIMPGMDGRTCYRHITERVPSLRGRVIFLTVANRDPEVFRDIEQLGVPLLSKTDNLQLVLDAVRLAILQTPGHEGT